MAMEHAADSAAANDRKARPSSGVPESFVVGLAKIDKSQTALVGGKGALLGELMRIDGVHVPAGLCVTTDAYRRVMSEDPTIDDRIGQLSQLSADDRDSIRSLSAEIRVVIEAITIPGDIATAITDALEAFDPHASFAVRSSATAEDLPTASFAGQQDTYLDIVGATAILRHVSRCWASLFSERAVTYRLRNGFDQRAVLMGVVVQQMVFADAAGVLFTADPVTSNRKVVTIEATFGLGEALVSGRVNPDVFRLRDGEVAQKSVGSEPAISDGQAVRLAQLGRRIEDHFGSPQDIEWCVLDDALHVVQSRPITTLFPIPQIGDGDNHVYVSVGHQQMMTDPMKPLGLSLWQLTAMIPMHEAAGRLFVDVAPRLASSTMRAAVVEGLGKSDPLIGDALRTIVDRGDFIPLLPTPDVAAATAPPGAAPAPLPTDPAIVTDLIAQNQASVAALNRDIRNKTGVALLDFILADIPEMKRLMTDPRSYQVFTSAMEASFWLNEHLQTWLGEKNVADVLTLSAPGNVTSEMGLALLDVADAIRPHPDVVTFLESVDDDGFLDELPNLPGGREARAAISGYLDTYGMRCVGEIDITRPRWAERPSTLVPLILGNVKHFQPGAGAKRFERGQLEASAKEHEIIERLRTLPDGAHKADETTRMIDRVRTFIGYREYPKYGIVCRFLVYKLALMEEAERLVHGGIIRERDNIFFLTMHELRDVVANMEPVGDELIRRRTEAFVSYQALTPPRVMTSDGEVVTGAYHRDDLPAGALVGLAVSAGTVEGRARVILDMAEAEIDVGDILITTYTDPSWSPLFVAISGLVTEVGGMMTHGAVVAREYGLPAVVGVENITRLIEDGQRIRVNGSDGYIEILSER